ncbi:MAG: S-layer homology domain-containing protein [Candidatus Margulisbacteria bacterium]|nr:S-layer homology domain-containing protein [Candidatus Margulisiibacteriota bacterium]MBU1867711.1 S-layer homology domain-containing protein [Candidatus Margulisiibacteriota bacterium]
MFILASSCLLVIFSLVVFAFPAQARLNELGINPFATEVGGRPLGMAGAVVALTDDPNGALYNPASLAWAKGIAITNLDIDRITVAGAYPTGLGSSFGLAVVNTSIENLPYLGSLRTSKSSLVVLSYGTKLFFFPAYAKNPVLQRVGLGVSFKSILSETFRGTGINDRSANGWTVDLGGIYKPNEWLAVGLALQNIIPQKSFGGGEILWDDSVAEPITAYHKIGFSAKVIGPIGSLNYSDTRQLVMGGELDFASTNPTLLRIGGEYTLNKIFILQAGLMEQWRPGGLSFTPTWGVGLRSEEWAFTISGNREPIKDEGQVLVSGTYFPKEWVVFKKLDVERPSVFLETAIERISLEDNFVTYDETLEVTGKVKPGVDVYVNNYLASKGKDNSFRVVVPLKLGKNLVVVEARNEQEMVSWTYKVLRKARISVEEENDLKKKLERTISLQEQEALRKKEAELKKRRSKVEELVTIGVINVDETKGEFKLEATITRGELATWLVKSADLPLPEVTKDVSVDIKRTNPLAAYYKAAIDWNLMPLYSDGTFRPDAPVTKEESERLFKVLGVKR